MRETVSAGARASSLVMPSFDDEQAHFGDADIAATIARYRGLGVDNIVVKDGPKGVTLSFGDTPLQFVPSANVEKIVDTTSAGDSFNGAFLARYAVDGDASVAARFAAEAAATVIQHHGALVSRDKFEASL
ncbi:2-dehydro-3-deoxygluconokinase [compost metagenome]